MSFSRERMGESLRALARAAMVEAVVGKPDPGVRPPAHDPALDALGASFVTLTVDGRLRGCIGTIEPRRPLVEDVRSNARAAALEDRRFPPVTVDELAAIAVEVSVLSPLVEIEHRDRAHLLTLMRRGEDGLVLQHGEHRATFLPQVWAGLPEPEDFVGALVEKAGLPKGFWADDMRAWRFSVEKYV